MAFKLGTVTTRRYIRRNDGEAVEATSTLVLTSPRGHFVDIRPLKKSSSSPPLPLPAVSRDVVEPIPGTTGILRLQWAFGGIATTTERSDGTQHCAWTHLVDSQTLAVKDEVDEGIMEIRKERGLDGELYEWEVESGESVGSDGSKQTYEEGWLSLPVCLDMHRPYQSIDDKRIRLVPAQQIAGTCLVLATPSFFDGATKLPLGMIIKVGDWCQGILRTSEHVLYAARWWETQGRWEKLLSIGPEDNGDGGMEKIIDWMTRGLTQKELDRAVMDGAPSVPKWHGAEFVLADGFGVWP